MLGLPLLQNLGEKFMDSYYAATASTLVQPKCLLHANLQPQALLALLYDRYLSRHLAKRFRNSSSND